MAKKANKPDIGLLHALEFISVAQRANGSDNERHCMLSDHAAVAFNGVIAAGARIQDDLRCCPQTAKLIAALGHCDPGWQIAQLQDRLVIQSGEFTANVPIMDGTQLQWAWPDPKLIDVNDDLRAALMAVVGVVNEKSDRVHESAILMQANNCTATNGVVILESWHGWQLPPDILLPKAAVTALTKVKKPIVGVGYGATTVTFWYADNTWLRSQRYLAKWPKSTLLDTPTHPIALPLQLFQAAEALRPFSENGNLYCWQGKASSHPFATPNAFNGQLRADVPGITASRVYSLATLDDIAAFATSYDDTTLPKRTFVYGVSTIKLGTKKSESQPVRVRGVFSHSTEDGPARDPALPPPVGTMETWQTRDYAYNVSDDDIPF